MKSCHNVNYYKQYILKSLQTIVKDVHPDVVRQDQEIQTMIDSIQFILSINQTQMIDLVNEEDKVESMEVITSSSTPTTFKGIHNHNINLPNQFQFNETRIACISISVLAIYHLYKNIEANEDFFAECDDLSKLLSAASLLHSKWKNMYSPYSNAKFPTIDEVLSLPECKPFVDTFGRDTKEYCGIAVQSGNNANNPEGDLTKLFKDMSDTAIKENRVVCALIVLPHNACIAAISRFLPYTKSRYSIILFDSHGGGGFHLGGSSKSKSELIESWNHVEAAQYLIAKYNIKPLTHSMTQRKGFYKQSDESIVSQYGYCAKLFIK